LRESGAYSHLLNEVGCFSFLPIDLGWRLSAKRGKWAFVIVVFDPLSDAPLPSDPPSWACAKMRSYFINRQSRSAKMVVRFLAIICWQAMRREEPALAIH